MLKAKKTIGQQNPVEYEADENYPNDFEVFANYQGVIERSTQLLFY